MLINAKLNVFWLQILDTHSSRERNLFPHLFSRIPSDHGQAVTNQHQPVTTSNNMSENVCAKLPY